MTFSVDAVPAVLQFHLEHDFEATPEALYEAFTSAEVLPKWFGPEGWSVPLDTVEINPVVGGTQKFTMVNDENPEMTSPSNATFTALEPGKLVEGVETSVDEDGNENAFGMRVIFEPVSETVTRMVLLQGPMPAEIQVMAKQGWESSFNKLKKVLAA